MRYFSARADENIEVFGVAGLGVPRHGIAPNHKVFGLMLVQQCDEVFEVGEHECL
jgi:hypothetical protein